LLEYFLLNQNRVISRDELMSEVWDRRIVSDDAVNRCISILRQTLTPDDKNAYIETVVRKGYLAHFPPGPVTAKSKSRPPRRYKLAMLAAVPIFTMVGMVLFFVLAGPGDQPTQASRQDHNTTPPMVAVLPFTSASPSGDDDFFANGMHNDLLTQLAKLQSLRVISSTSVQEYRGNQGNIRKIGEELGADVILEGSVQTAEDRIRINAQLIDARTDEHLWAESYDRNSSLTNIFDVQKDIALAISEAMHATLTTQESQQLAVIPTDNMAAYRAYHRALTMRDRDFGAPNTQEYLDLLEEAVELDPSFSRAWAELVTTLAYQNFSGDKPDMTRRAEQALLRLKELAPDSADYLIGQSAYIYYALKDYDRAHDLIDRAIAMNPSDASAVRLRSWIERRQGDFEAMVASRREARRLDPRNPALIDMLLGGLMISHRYDELQSEVDASSLNSYLVGFTRALLRFREDRDFQQWLASIETLCEFYDEPDCGWEAHIANRDYPGALDTLDQPVDEIDSDPVSKNDRRLLFTQWLMNDGPLPRQWIQDLQAQLDQDRVDSDSFRHPPSYIAEALLAGLQGDVEEAERWIERWLRQEPVDWAERANGRTEACRVLGMIEATHATVKCIRDGLKEPSLVMPFLEPYLPFYDALRDKPEFIEMLVEVDGDAAESQLY